MAAFLPGNSRFTTAAVRSTRKRLGITCERMSLVEPAYGSTAVTTLEALNVDQALGQIIASNLLFDVWYRERLQKLHGINLAGYELFSKPTPLPENQEVYFEWTFQSNQYN